MVDHRYSVYNNNNNCVRGHSDSTRELHVVPPLPPSRYFYIITSFIYFCARPLSHIVCGGGGGIPFNKLMRVCIYSIELAITAGGGAYTYYSVVAARSTPCPLYSRPTAGPFNVSLFRRLLLLLFSNGFSPALRNLFISFFFFA